MTANITKHMNVTTLEIKTGLKGFVYIHNYGRHSIQGSGWGFLAGGNPYALNLVMVINNNDDVHKCIAKINEIDWIDLYDKAECTDFLRRMIRD
ncbi:hypothetical protein P4H71_04220 [Paenibacillus kribbensis]|uniref:hypothetical protein n=1 Tax=Paenibacillus kribbensis TaxID=172713 RepID=UPI002DBBDBBC|nr:hypothetical protein [Paenibacillus kribbensis]MEC0233560.1 hypothetical protein [Paenibacillus kribbensis]